MTLNDIVKRACQIPKMINLRAIGKYKFIEVPNPRIRTLLEAYTIGNLCLKHLGTGTIFKINLSSFLVNKLDI